METIDDLIAAIRSRPYEALFLHDSKGRAVGVLLSAELYAQKQLVHSSLSEIHASRPTRRERRERARERREVKQSGREALRRMRRLQHEKDRAMKLIRDLP